MTSDAGNVYPQDNAGIYYFGANKTFVGNDSEVLYPEKVTDISDLDQIQGYERNNLIIKYGDLISL